MKTGKSNSQPVIRAFISEGFIGRTGLLFSTWFGAGLSPKASGTVGSLAALPVIAAIHSLGDIYVGISLIILIPISIWASDISRELLNKEDPSEVVIDEVAGMMLTLFFMPLSWISYLLGFVLFRFFDILKPFPIGWVDKNIKGGAGIVLDDLVAGIFANISLWVIYIFFKG